MATRRVIQSTRHAWFSHPEFYPVAGTIMLGLGCLSYNVTHQAFHNPDIKINRHSRSAPFIHDVEEAEAWDGHHKEMSRWNRPGVDVGKVSIFEWWFKPKKQPGLAAQYGPAPPAEPGKPQVISEEDIDVNAFPNKPSPPPVVTKPEFVRDARASQADRMEKPAPAWTPSLHSTHPHTSLPPYPGIGPKEVLGAAHETKREDVVLVKTTGRPQAPVERDVPPPAPVEVKEEAGKAPHKPITEDDPVPKPKTVFGKKSPPAGGADTVTGIMKHNTKGDAGKRAEASTKPADIDVDRNVVVEKQAPKVPPADTVPEVKKQDVKRVDDKRQEAHQKPVTRDGDRQPKIGNAQDAKVLPADTAKEIKKREQRESGKETPKPQEKPAPAKMPSVDTSNPQTSLPPPPAAGPEQTPKK